MVREGRVELEVPELERFLSPSGDYIPSKTRVFYNPHMELSRDIGVAVVQIVARKLGPLRLCDPMAGVGVRGLRYAVEVEGVEEAVLNDRSGEARQFIRRNLELNKPHARVEIEGKDANVLMWERRGRFDLVDLDPFGSPAPFLESACAALKKRGVLALSATDTAPLCGAYPRACLRRYGARSLRTEYCHELGVRILVGFAQRVAGKHGLALEPLLVHATRHYFRVYLMGEKRKSKVDEVLKSQGAVSHCFSCGRREVHKGIPPLLRSTCECGSELRHAGPLWLGRLADPEFVREVMRELAGRGFRLAVGELKLLALMSDEADGPPTFYSVNEVARRARKPPISPKTAVERLRKQGFWASRTHFSPEGIRSDAPFETIVATCGGEAEF